MNAEYWAQYCDNKRRLFGARFVPPMGCDHLIPLLNSGQRVEVEAYGYVTRGFVGITTGWMPSFILLRTKRSIGSHILLDKQTKILRFLKY